MPIKRTNYYNLILKKYVIPSLKTIPNVKKVSYEEPKDKLVIPYISCVISDIPLASDISNQEILSQITVRLNFLTENTTESLDLYFNICEKMHELGFARQGKTETFKNGQYNKYECEATFTINYNAFRNALERI